MGISKVGRSSAAVATRPKKPVGPGVKDVSISCRDGVELSGTLYTPSTEPRAAALMSSGAGYKMSFYRHLAQYLADNGILVLTYDNRGIGSSATPKLLESSTLIDWGKEDQPAAIRFLSEFAPNLELFHLAHSMAGHVAGFSSEVTKFKKQLFIASGVGTFWLHKPSRWPLEFYFWWILGEFSLRTSKHLKSMGGWTGSPLPGPMFRTWRSWSHKGDYLGSDIQSNKDASYFQDITHPIQSWVFTDDGIATIPAAKKILTFYPNAESEIVVFRPEDYQKSSIGHDGLYKSKHSDLWPDVLRFFDE